MAYTLQLQKLGCKSEDRVDSSLETEENKVMEQNEHTLAWRFPKFLSQFAVDLEKINFLGFFYLVLLIRGVLSMNLNVIT